jgi:hypothetical protein
MSKINKNLQQAEDNDKTLLLFDKMSYKEILNAITKERTLLNIHGSDGKSIIHHILANSDLRNSDKYSIIKSITNFRIIINGFFIARF